MSAFSIEIPVIAVCVLLVGAAWAGARLALHRFDQRRSSLNDIEVGWKIVRSGPREQALACQLEEASARIACLQTELHRIADRPRANASDLAGAIELAASTQDMIDAFMGVNAAANPDEAIATWR